MSNAKVTEDKPVEVKPAEKAAPSKYLVVELPPHVDAANAVLAKAADDGYTKLLNVYVVATPSSASLAFAVLSA